MIDMLSQSTLGRVKKMGTTLEGLKAFHYVTGRL